MHRPIAVLIGLVALAPLPALAHPHIFVDAKAAITFNDAGEVVSIHNSWTFDEAYSAWSIQGLDTNGDGKVTREELQPLADDNMNGLADYEYYTFAGEGKDPNLKFSHGSNPTIDFDGKQTTLNFDVALAQPYAIGKSLEVSIDDPEYYVAITFKDKSDIQLINAPKNCAIAMQDAKEMPPELADALYALPPDVTKLPPELAQAMRGMQGEILINCPGGSATGKGGATQTAALDQPPATALDAVNALSATSAPEAPGDAASIEPPGKQVLTVPAVAGRTPFGVAPAEPGLNWPLPGFLGELQSWVRQQDADFYRGLSQSLSALKGNWAAFWLLGGLSFLYGIIHAAGPGHGKVVIASYMFANEAQVRRGIMLSFVSAMLQSLVAIAFVLVAASVLGMTAMAMADAANWIGVLSYGMIVLLGLWLVLRKIFGWGHRHEHDHEGDGVFEAPATNAMQSLARRHMGVPAHALAAGGPQLTSFTAVAAGADSYGRMPGHAHYGHHHDDDEHDHDHDGHAHVVTPAQLKGSWREQLGVVLAVGMRPCSGALIVLAFAWSQELIAAGIVAVLLMGMGTAITTGVLATLAVWFKGAARTLARADNTVTARVVWWAEVLAAVAVMAVGVVLVLASV